MRNKRWLRLGLASLTVGGGALGAFLVACGDDDNGSSGGPPDAALVDTQQPPTDAPVDAPVDAGQVGKIIGVNAITDLGPSSQTDGVRVCFGLGPAENMAPPTALLPPLPDRPPAPGIPPALYVGTGGAFAGTGASIAAFYLVPYIMNSDSLFAKGVVPPGDKTPGRTCADLLTNDGGTVDGGIVEGVDFWKLPAIPPNTFANNTTKLLVLTGCASNATDPPETCGPGFTPTGSPGNGNLKINVYDLDRSTPIAAGSMGIEFIHASPQVALALDDGGISQAQPGLAQADGGNFRTFGAGGVALYGKTNLVQIPNVNVQNDYLVMHPAVVSTAISLATTQDISFAATQGDAGTQGYASGKAFTFVAVGDPNITPGPGVTKFFHYLGFPNDPVVTTYSPP